MAHSAPVPPPDDPLAAQLAARESASRDDAAVLAPLRSEAAARALGIELPDGRLPAVPVPAAAPLPTPVVGGPADQPVPAPVAAPTHEPPAATAEPPHAPTTPPPPAEPPAAKPVPPGVVLPSGGPAPAATGVLARARAKGAHPPTDDAVMELKPTVLATDIDRIGDQLVVMRDRLELRDRHGGLRRTVAIADIVDVEVQRRLTSAVLSVLTRTSTDMVVKGLRPETAEAARLAILDLRPADPPPAAPVDERTLMRAILELHRAGVLDDREMADKTALVARMAGGHRA